MKAWIVDQWCEPDRMRWADVAVPEPGPGQVRVKVAAAALNFLDTLMIQGKYQVKPPLPFTPGVEISGIVDATGAGVPLALGTPVVGTVAHGGYAEYAIAEAAQLAPLPAGVDLGQAATMPIVYPTAHLCLRDAGRMKAGDTVLVTAAAGGVGLAAIQLAKIWGAGRIVAAAGQRDKLEVCRTHGADMLIDYNETGWAEQLKTALPQGADVIIDMVGGEVADAAFRQIAWRGRFVVVGFTSGTIPALPANRLLLKSASAVGVFWGATTQREPHLARQVQAELFDLLAAGRLAPILSARYPLAEAPRAMRDLGARRTTGKVVLEP